MDSLTPAEQTVRPTMIEHAGYFAEVWKEDVLVHVSVTNSSDALHATCGTAEEAEATLRDLVEDYVTVCGYLKKTPSRR